MSNPVAERKCPNGRHKLNIVREDDGEIPELYSDYCARCNHKFTLGEMEKIHLSCGGHCEKLWASMMVD